MNNFQLEPGTQKLSFKPPQLDEEEERSPLIPDVQRCDGCFAAAHQMHLAFARAHKNFRDSKKRLKESQILDLFGEMKYSMMGGECIIILLLLR